MGSRSERQPDKPESEYMDRLRQIAEQFRRECYTKRWSHAKYLYDKAIHVAEFLQLQEHEKTELFGNGGCDERPENHTDGLFPEELCIRAYDECTVKLYESYEHESYRRFGQPPRYYPQPRYPVPGYPKNGH